MPVTDLSNFDTPSRSTDQLQDKYDDLEALRLELRQNMARLAEAQRIGQVGSWDYDMVHERLHMSSETLRIFDWPPGQAPDYDKLVECMHPDDRERVREMRRATLSHHTPYSTEYRILIANGSLRHIFERCGLTCDRDKERKRVV